MQGNGDLIQELTLYSADDIEGLNTLYNVCNDLVINTLYDDLNYSDFDNIKPLHWNYILDTISQKVFSSNPAILHDNSMLYNQYDLQKVDAVYSKVFKRLSLKYSQEVTILRFTYFTGIERQTLYNWSNANKAKPGGLDILQKIKADNEEILSNILNDKNINALGVIAKLNHWHNWKDDSSKGNTVNISFSDSPLNVASRYSARISQKDSDQDDENT